MKYTRAGIVIMLVILSQGALYSHGYGDTYDSPWNTYVSTEGGQKNSYGYPAFGWCAAHGDKSKIQRNSMVTAGQVVSAPGCANQASAVCAAINPKYYEGDSNGSYLKCWFDPN